MVGLNIYLKAQDYPLWRGSLLPLGGVAVVGRVQVVYLEEYVAGFGAALPPSGSKLPRHRGWVLQSRAVLSHGIRFTWDIP
ncbi:hypothetical protein SRABI112_01346 [Pseudomonas mediterranea]|uniref:Uncharacterized protein n=1 Tax=Pseudomonas mediterranea TaxID=183795 RepID=A0AAX2D970_9PSED|nr:hypothetical protein SRABI112_01346 [Pseudomonas mediterranea]SDU35828.1 hypothetical protein SAMN05216476_1646 [Pseudomonas mediterranea]